MIETIKNYVQEYDRILVLSTGLLSNETIIRGISNYAGKKTLLLIKNHETVNFPKNNVNIQSISGEQYRSIEKLYYTYEFSDRICLLTDGNQYGSLVNYILSGWLTEEQAFAALLQS